MGFGSDGRLGDQHMTDSAPAYSLLSKQTVTAIGVASLLIISTIAMMWAFRDTVFATGTIWLYTDAPFAPFAGLLVFGIILSAGRYFGLSASMNENYGLALGASAIVAVAYGAFGAGILSLYASDLHVAALGWTAAITVAITLGAATLVYTTDHSFANWGGYASFAMIGGAFAYLIYTIIPSTVFVLLAFGLILLGWIIDLVYEIFMVSDARRKPVANGIGVYIAFMGVFVHILQLVLEFLAND